MSNFQAEHVVFVLTVIASATIEAGDLVAADGSVAANAADGYVGVAMSDAASGESVPTLQIGVANLLIASGSSGIAKGDRVDYDTDGIDTVVGGGIGVALDAGSAEGYTRVLLNAVGVFTPATALTAANAATIDGTYGAEEQGVLGNVRTRVGEIEAALVAAGILTAA